MFGDRGREERHPGPGFLVAVGDDFPVDADPALTEPLRCCLGAHAGCFDSFPHGRHDG